MKPKRGHLAILPPIVKHLTKLTIKLKAPQIKSSSALVGSMLRWDECIKICMPSTSAEKQRAMVNIILTSVPSTSIRAQPKVARRLLP